MSLTAWLPLAMVCLLGAMSPGPSLAIIVRHTLGGGRVCGVTAAWSHAMGIGAYALMTVMGLSALMAHSPRLLTFISMVGGLYLLWIGIQSLRAKHSIAAKLESGQNSSWRAAMRDALAISLLSPKIMLFFIALFSPLVAVSSHHAERGLLVTTPLLIDGLWYSLVVLTLSRPMVLSWMRSNAQWIDRLSGLVLVALGLWVMTSAGLLSTVGI
jgi:threonine/homoserine/homoserine lactone efflux protein